MIGVGCGRPSGGGGGSTPTLTIGVFSDAGLTNPITTANFNDTIYINLSVSGITATNYRFFVSETNAFELTEQSSATLEWTVGTFNDIMIYAEGDDGSIISASLDVFTVAINSDIDAEAFIAKHNAESGQTMAIAQQQVIQGLFQRIKGIGTTFGSDLWTLLVNSNSEVYPFCPVSDSVINVAACAVDMIDPSVTASFVNFLPSDFTANGITGASSKYMEMKRAPSDFNQNSIGIDGYNRSSLIGTRTIVGVNDGTAANSTGTLAFLSNYKINGSFVLFTDSSVLGLNSLNRTTATHADRYRDGVLVKSQTNTSAAPITNKFYGFANNTGSVSEYYFTGELAMIAARRGFTTNEMADWNEAWLYYQTNIITGGRNV